MRQLIRFNKENKHVEIVRGMRLKWAAYVKLKYILKDKKFLYLKIRVFRQCSLPIITYPQDEEDRKNPKSNSKKYIEYKIER